MVAVLSKPESVTLLPSRQAGTGGRCGGPQARQRDTLAQKAGGHDHNPQDEADRKPDHQPDARPGDVGRWCGCSGESGSIDLVHVMPPQLQSHCRRRRETPDKYGNEVDQALTMTGGNACSRQRRSAAGRRLRHLVSAFYKARAGAAGPVRPMMAADQRPGAGAAAWCDAGDRCPAAQKRLSRPASLWLRRRAARP